MALSSLCKYTSCQYHVESFPLNLNNWLALTANKVIRMIGGTMSTGVL